jgi:hypothetical protein
LHPSLETHGIGNAQLRCRAPKLFLKRATAANHKHSFRALLVNPGSHVKKNVEPLARNEPACIADNKRIERNVQQPARALSRVQLIFE